MEAKVHRQHQRHRRTEARQRRLEREAVATGAAAPPPTTPERAEALDCATALNEGVASADPGGSGGTPSSAGRISAQSSADSIELVGSPSQTSQQTVVLVNGHAPPGQEEGEEESPLGAGNTRDSPPPPKQSDGSRNSSGDAMSLRETLQQLPATHHHRSRRTHSPADPDASFHRGILGYMDRELKQSSPTPSAPAATGNGTGNGTSTGASRKQQSLSDPQASPAQRSLRSRSSFDKSPRRKRSKSESRRRRERKLIAAGEMEVRQANETLMRYLKQCSDMHDASLSGELEIDQSLEERRVHRKTKSQRDKRGQLISKLYSAGGISSILKELADDIAPADGEEIYNPFTPVVSPTDDAPAHIDKMFLQTSSGYRPVEHSYYKRSFLGAAVRGTAGISASGGGGGCGGGGGGGRLDGISAAELGGAGRLFRSSGSHAHGGAGMGGNGSGRGSYGDTRCLLDADFNRSGITSNIQLACVVQRIWLLISNICHGLLAGLALAHLLFVLSSHPMDWAKVINGMSLAGETVSSTAQPPAASTPSPMDLDSGDRGTESGESSSPSAAASGLALISDYAGFAEIYLNTFYCLAIICLVSVFDRMDICRWSFSNASELISFRWLIITMIYVATIILTICSDSIDEKLYLFNNNANITLTQQEMLSNSVQSVWSSLSVTRSIAAISGWIMIGLTPQEDMLYEHLVDLTKYQLTNN
ncbi:H2.0-like homeobox protein isoform X1 [Drosophila mauritiana]|uniref:H2.0-like homeobox protein isoform X1 n=1 Tax=Drosophila mauritiana TaxID=7226 RepID=A0A6P8KB16_DROMA|nr:H2.0-like homeobox protein isoform X1 [Drosophila mauritiana]